MSMPNIFSRDLDSALAFYRDRLGFTEQLRVPSEGQPEHVVLRLGDSRLAISTERAIAGTGLEPHRGNPVELILWCEDVDGQAARLHDAGVDILVAPYDHIGGHRRAYVADPDGNWLALVDAN